MAVGASKPTVVVDKDGFFSIKNEMLVSLFSYLHILCAYRLLFSLLSFFAL